MKWMLLCLSLLSANTYASKQFNEAECILLKHQITDYKRRLGVNSSLYQKTKKVIKTHCKSPTLSTKKHSQVVTVPSTNKPTPITIHKPALSKIDIKKPTRTSTATPLSIVINALLSSWPIWIIMFLLIILRLPSVKGKLGEIYVSRGLRKKLPSDQYNVINNVTLPLDDGGTTQVDHIVISPFGVFVIETKNMKGWIFGNEKQAKWTQTIYRSKYSFQNPLRQNYKHTQTLAHLLNIPAEYFHSVIIFTNNAEFKTKMPANVGYLKGMLTYIKSMTKNLLSPKEQLNIESKISTLSLKRGIKTNKAHVNYLKAKHD